MVVVKEKKFLLVSGITGMMEECHTEGVKQINDNYTWHIQGRQQ